MIEIHFGVRAVGQVVDGAWFGSLRLFLSGQLLLPACQLLIEHLQGALLLERCVRIRVVFCAHIWRRRQVLLHLLLLA